MMKIFPHKQALQNGFSLLEILVVLAIMGIMLSIVSVNLTSSISAVRFSQTVDAAIGDIKLLRIDAMLTNQGKIIVTNDTQDAILQTAHAAHVKRYNVPKDWTVSGDTVRILSSGVCLGGDIVFANADGKLAKYTLIPPKCEAMRTPLAPLANNK